MPCMVPLSIYLLHSLHCLYTAVSARFISPRLTFPHRILSHLFALHLTVTLVCALSCNTTLPDLIQV